MGGYQRIVKVSRTAEWKLILFVPGRMDGPAAQAGLVKGELYNLKDDPHEWTNLYADARHAAVREQMKTELLTYLALAWARGPNPPAPRRTAPAGKQPAPKP